MSNCSVNKVTECIKSRRIIRDFWSSKSGALFTLPLYFIEETNLNGWGTQRILDPMRTLKDQMESWQAQPQKDDKSQFLQSEVRQPHLGCRDPEVSLYVSGEQPNT